MVQYDLEHYVTYISKVLFKYLFAQHSGLGFRMEWCANGRLVTSDNERLTRVLHCFEFLSFGFLGVPNSKSLVCLDGNMAADSSNQPNIWGPRTKFTMMDTSG
jgi:hypothetical protein